MPKIAKRALWGYDSVAVDEWIATLQAEHEERCRQKQEQIEALQRATEKLRVETMQLKHNEQQTADPNEPVAELLLSAHLEQTKLVAEMHQEIKRLSERNAEVLKISDQHRETVIQEVMDKMRNMESLIQRNGREGEHGSLPHQEPPVRTESEEGERLSAPVEKPAGHRVERAGGEA